jgi:hypothetical protein
VVWTAAVLIHPFVVWAQSAAPASREYVGPTVVDAQPVARQPVTGGTGTSGAASPPPNTDLSRGDVFGPSASPATPATPATSTPAAGPVEGPAAGPTVEVGAGGQKPGDLSMDDVFGSTGQTAPPSTAPPAAPSTTRSSATPTIGPIKGLVDLENPGADRGGPAPTVGYGGKLKTRFRLLSSVYYDVDKTASVRGVDGVYRSAPRRLSRNENRLELYVAYTPNKHVQIVADAEPVLMGMSMARELDDLANPQMTQRFHMESDAAYIALTDIAPGLDIKLGRQIVVWGTADKFNPTNNINADDLEDRPLFTEPIANQMAVVDYAPLGDKLYLQGVYVPLFTPALLPPSAALGLRDPFAEAPYASRTERDKITYLQEDWLPRNSKFVPEVYGHVLHPENAFRNGQVAFKLGSKLGEVDLSASYYYGRHDIPVPQTETTTMLAPLDASPAPANGYYFRADIDLVYPKMQVIGLDFATQIPFLGNMGLWGEAALIIPRAHTLTIDIPLPGGLDVTPKDDTMVKETSIVGYSIKPTPFVKATVGFDYTFGKHVYVQAQYLRGFINEFGAGHIGNYVVGGTDLIFFGRKLVFRAFGVVDFPSNNPDKHLTFDRKSVGGPSGVIAPALLFAPPWGYVNFEVGGFALLGANKTAFGQAATGSSIAYFKVIGSF